MRPSARAAFVGFSIPLEALVPWMYLDIKGLVTTAIGVLIDPMQEALPLPWLNADGTPATQGAIASEWIRIHGMSCMAHKEYPGMGLCPWRGTGRKCLAHLGHHAARDEAHLHLDPEGIDLVVARKMAQMESYLAKRFPEWEEWPADAQLATLSMSWACGPAFKFPNLVVALRERDFATAAVECHINEKGNPGIIPRNRANVAMYRNAAYVVRQERDPEELIWPQVLDDVPTRPDLTNPASEPTVVVAPMHIDPNDDDCDDDVS